MVIGDGALRKTVVKVEQITPEYLICKYATVPQNQPSSNSNFVQAWQDSQVEWSNPTGGWKANVAGTSTQGDLAVSIAYQKKDYIVGYGVGSSVQNIVATAFLPGGDMTQQQLFSTYISVAPGQDSLLVDYVTPESCTPQTFGHWVGLFNADDNPYADTPVAKGTLMSDKRAGSVPIIATLLAGRSYTVAYFGGKQQNCVACTFTFATNA
ncbi:MAG: hypothetical protein JWN15_3489 [Firmicutes bacterium]|nr:hypothetical protein [Bacillota bacterium]